MQTYLLETVPVIDGMTDYLATIAARTIDYDGYTAKLDDETPHLRVPTTGYAVGIAPTLTVVIDRGDKSRTEHAEDIHAALRAFITQPAVTLLLTNPDTYIGTWYDGQATHIDVTHIYTDRSEAIAAGILAGQQAIWNIDTEEIIEL